MFTPSSLFYPYPIAWLEGYGSSQGQHRLASAGQHDLDITTQLRQHKLEHTATPLGRLRTQVQLHRGRHGHTHRKDVVPPHPCDQDEPQCGARSTTEEPGEAAS